MERLISVAEIQLLYKSEDFISNGNFNMLKYSNFIYECNDKINEFNSEEQAHILYSLEWVKPHNDELLKELMQNADEYFRSQG